MLNCIDNSGAALVECALVVGQKRHARIGTPSQKRHRRLRLNLGVLIFPR